MKLCSQCTFRNDERKASVLQVTSGVYLYIIWHQSDSEYKHIKSTILKNRGFHIYMCMYIAPEVHVHCLRDVPFLLFIVYMYIYKCKSEWSLLALKLHCNFCLHTSPYADMHANCCRLLKLQHFAETPAVHKKNESGIHIQRMFILQAMKGFGLNSKPDQTMVSLFLPEEKRSNVNGKYV